MQNEKIRCGIIFLDAGMTIIRPTPQFEVGISTVFSENGFDVSLDDLTREARAALKKIIREIENGRRYAVSDEADEEFWVDIYEGIALGLGYAGDARSLGLKTYEFYTQPHSFELFEESLEALQNLDSDGFRLGIISNFATMLRDSLELRQVLHMFDPFVVSAAEGCMKPDKEIFDIAIERAGVPPELCVMVGDNPLDDGKGALSAGITPIIIDRPGKLSPNGMRVIRSLHELRDILIPAV